ncbi:MAG: hypothetical protein JST04_00815 [Bdellovibrionales bacterium]|nr:hypothetical protein [Bdellovibrionales bacterium]
MEYNDEFKIIDTEDKAYFLGLLFADGSISKENTVRISLVDKQLIDDLELRFPFFNRGEFDYSKYGENHKIQYSLAKSNKVLYQDLFNLGLRERKSTENKELITIPELDNNLMNHFIRGYFDGNGSISIPSLRPNLRRVEICSASEYLINKFKQILLSNCIDCPYYRVKENPTYNLYVLEWIASENILNLKDYLYKNCTISLKRKKELFDSFKIIDKTDNNPKCPKCGSNTKKNGTRQMVKGLVIRYKCDNCNKNYTLPAQTKSDELLETHKALSTIIFSKNDKDTLTTSSQAIDTSIEGSTTT